MWIRWPTSPWLISIIGTDLGFGLGFGLSAGFGVISANARKDEDSSFCFFWKLPIIDASSANDPPLIFNFGETSLIPSMFLEVFRESGGPAFELCLFSSWSIVLSEICPVIFPMDSTGLNLLPCASLLRS